MKIYDVYQTDRDLFSKGVKRDFGENKIINLIAPCLRQVHRILIVLLFVSCCPNQEDIQTDNPIRYPVERGYGTITDSTFYFFTRFTDESRDTSFWKCKPADIDQAMVKIWYSHIYASLNWAARKEYHEVLSKIKTERIY